MRPRVGFVGIGQMGLGMALRLLERGGEVGVHDLAPIRAFPAGRISISRPATTRPQRACNA